MPLKYGEPQGPVLGPVLYTLYTLSITETIKPYSVGYHNHTYADDTQLYTSGAPQRIGELIWRGLRWLGHVTRMRNDVLYGDLDLATGFTC
ncbi:reverse transcriptase-like protein [Elysia marginata]|uniref:Reverse transcriptase-like protein n=1 Tax=Elysia marginata TaxID=1093978 RepID=A0AAV4EDF6_9GAST|nr:reverse transcriptase-like protein [Elysia marginata]